MHGPMAPDGTAWYRPLGPAATETAGIPPQIPRQAPQHLHELVDKVWTIRSAVHEIVRLRNEIAAARQAVETFLGGSGSVESARRALEDIARCRQELERLPADDMDQLRRLLDEHLGDLIRQLQA